MQINYSFLNTKKTEVMIFLIIISSFIIDKFYLINISYLPAWDQGYHLANLFKTFNLLDNFSFNDQEWWKSFWSISETYRGPLTYIFSSIFLKFACASMYSFSCLLLTYNFNSTSNPDLIIAGIFPF